MQEQISRLSEEEKQSREVKKSIISFTLVLFSGLGAIMVAAALYLSFQYYPVVDIEEMIVDDPSVRYSIESIEVHGETLLITGWALQPNAEAISVFRTYFVLYDEQNEQYRMMKTKMNAREDVPQTLGLGEKLKNCGLVSKIELDRLQEDHLYEVCIYYGNDDNQSLLHTGKWVNSLGEVTSE